MEKKKDLKEMYTIYLRTNKVNGKQYVGQTGNFKRRENQWKSLTSDYGNQYIDGEREKYGLDNFNVVIIDYCETEEEAYQLEEYYINKFNTKYPYGYNMSDGGKGKNKIVLEEARRKISEKAKGKKLSEETKQKMSEARKGKKFSEEHKRKMSEARKGKKHSEEAKKKMSDAKKGKYVGENNPLYGKHHSEETKQKMSKNRKNKKSVLQYTLDGVLVKEYPSAREAERQTRIYNISSACNNSFGHKTAGGYIWKYKK